MSDYVLTLRSFWISLLIFHSHVHAHFLSFPNAGTSHGDLQMPSVKLKPHHCRNSFLSRSPKSRILLFDQDESCTLTAHNSPRVIAYFSLPLSALLLPSRPWLCLNILVFSVPVQSLCVQITEFHVPIASQSHPYFYRVPP